MNVPNQGCVICDSTWGNYWAEVEGQNMFFCCEICAIQFRNLVDEVKRRTGWKTIEEVKIRGDYRGRKCHATSTDSQSYSFIIRFNSEGGIQKFNELEKDHRSPD
jgi:YHS domain-containing protein